MSDFTGDYYFDSGIVIKQEPLMDNSMNSSASVPIPTRRAIDINDYRELSYDLESSLSPSFPETNIMNQIQATPDGLETNTLWGNRIVGLDVDLSKSDAFIRMDDDDIFQVDKADLIQGPTLAELNANDETLLGDLNFDDLLLPGENYNYVNGINTSSQHKTTPFMQMNNNSINRLNNNNHAIGAASSCPQTTMGFYRNSLELNTLVNSNPADLFSTKSTVPAFSPTSQNSSSSSLLLQSASSPVTSSISSLQQKHSTLHELLMKRENYGISPDRNILGQSVPGQNSTAVGSSSVKIPRTHLSRLSSSAPTHLGLEQIWQRREPRKHLLSTGSLVEAGSTSSISTGGVLSPDPQDFSHDEFESDEDSEHYEDFSSDNADSDDDDEPNTKHRESSKKERFFWQYNVQAKGPKGQRLVMKCKMEDPHVLNEITDPVFSPDCSVRGIKHSGKARKGDGNDLTPNARKLYNIGKELDKLGRIINDMTPVSELPFNVRPKTRKEKNKLASRACRLKKKAQHEANKIKLQGLEHEHKRLLNGISQAKQVLAAKLSESSAENQEELTSHMEKVMKNATKVKIAGHTTEYVNKIIDKVKSGTPHPAALDDL